MPRARTEMHMMYKLSIHQPGLLAVFAPHAFCTTCVHACARTLAFPSNTSSGRPGPSALKKMRPSGLKALMGTWVCHSRGPLWESASGTATKRRARETAALYRLHDKSKGRLRHERAMLPGISKQAAWKPAKAAPMPTYASWKSSSE